MRVVGFVYDLSRGVQLWAHVGLPKKRAASLPGVELSYFDTGGNGTLVVFVHAFTGTSESWANQLEAFAAEGYLAIALDRRGWGKVLPTITQTHSLVLAQRISRH